MITLPPGSGKTVFTAVLANFLKQMLPDKKIILSGQTTLHNAFIKDDIAKANIHTLAANHNDVNVKGTAGVFLCTHREVLKMSDGVLSESIVILDEYHAFRNQGWGDGIKKVKSAGFVIAASASIGDGHQQDILKNELAPAEVDFKVMKDIDQQ